MFISASIIESIKVGDPVVIKRDRMYGELLIYGIDGATVGIAMDCNVEGCLTKNYISSRLGDNKVLGEVKLISGNIIIIECDSPILGSDRQKMIKELNNYRKCFA